MNPINIALVLIPLVFLLSCSSEPAGPSPPDAGLESISADSLAENITRLSSDEFEGRLPGTAGEQLTIDYLAEQFRDAGLRGVGPDGSFFQPVPLLGITSEPQRGLTFSRGSRRIQPQYQDEYVAGTRHVVEQEGISDSEVVFVGYSVVAPEYGWNDFKDLDVNGKTLIVLVNDPAVPDPSDPSKLDERMFKGRAMTYYGRWSYKYEIASEKGAAACFIIHETEPAGYPWEVVHNGWTGEQFDLVASDMNMGRVAIEGWISVEAAENLLRLAGKNLTELKEAATRADFEPVSLGVTASVSVENTLKPISSNNVIAVLEGSDPVLKDEYVIYQAHWDHLGRDENLEGDQIYNGARDNATGTSALLELARAFSILEVPPRRSILFLASTAEEQGLLGSRFYAERPLLPLEKTVAVINMDAMNIWGRTSDVTVVGLGNSTLDDVLSGAADKLGRTLRADPEPEKGFFYRSDHFSFAKQGVPALYVDPGMDFLGQPEGWGMERRQEYTTERYHKPADEFDDSWDLSGLAEDLQLLLEVGHRVANQDNYPEWREGTEFKAKRDQMLGDAGL